jgi:hypothetical protein
LIGRSAGWLAHYSVMSQPLDEVHAKLYRVFEQAKALQKKIEALADGEFRDTTQKCVRDISALIDRFRPLFG